MRAAVLLAESPSPGSEVGDIQPWEVTPGIMGFIFGFFLLAVALIPLFRSLVKHMRRVEHNAELRRREDEARAGQAGSGEPVRSGEAAPAEDLVEGDGGTGRGSAVEQADDGAREGSGPRSGSAATP